MRVLVTGGGGFIGTRVASLLETFGHDAVIFDGTKNVVDYPQVRRAVYGMHGVINLAGVLGTSEILGAEGNAVEVNILGAVNVFDAAKDEGIPVVQIGTGHKGQPNPYAITKGCAEDLGLARATYNGDRINIVRAYHTYGPGQKPCPPHGPSRVRKIVPSFICRALTGMPLEVNGNGKQMIDLVFVDDVAQVLVDALNYVTHGFVFEAGTGVGTTVLDAARTIIDYCESSSEIEHLPMRPGEPPDTTVTARTPLARCEHPWPWALESTIDHYRRMLTDAGMLP